MKGETTINTEDLLELIKFRENQEASAHIVSWEGDTIYLKDEDVANKFAEMAKECKELQREINALLGTVKEADALRNDINFVLDCYEDTISGFFTRIIRRRIRDVLNK